MLSPRWALLLAVLCGRVGGSLKIYAFGNEAAHESPGSTREEEQILQRWYAGLGPAVPSDPA